MSAVAPTSGEGAQRDRHEAEPTDTSELDAKDGDDAGEEKPEPAKSRGGNPAFVRPYYETLEKRLLSQARVLENNGNTLRDWFEGMDRREFRKAVDDALRNFDLPSDRALYDAGKLIVTDLEKRGLLDRPE